MKVARLSSYGLAAVLTVVGMAVAVPAHATTVSYSVDGVGPTSYPAPTLPPASAPWGTAGYAGDTVELQTYTGSLDLTPGTYTQQINTLLWTIDYTYGGTATDPGAWSDVNFSLNVARNITIDGVVGALGQTGSLNATYDNDYLAFSAGPTITLLVDGYNVAVTPLGVPLAAGSNFSGDNPWVQPNQIVNAQFDVTVAATPVPAALPLFASGLGLMGFLARRKRRKNAAA